jgi:pyruvate/2-oxoglutarate dehydrogenase complex dihydrolipoamide dehydrogenase (E3) component
VGAEVAHMLAEQGRDVTMLEMLPYWGHGMPPDAKWHIEREFAHLPVRILLNTKVSAVEEGAVHATQDGDTVTFHDVDTVVVAAGARPSTSLVPAIAALVPQVEVIGDAVRPRSALEAIAEGSRAGRRIGGTASS